jgi:hypothetical protein
MPNGYVIYHGPSEIDSQPIIAIATGFENKSLNRKTGPDLLQVWILREDISPVDAVLNGADFSICGSCSLRGIPEKTRVTDRKCYVPVNRAPVSVWRCYQRGAYPLTVEPHKVQQHCDPKYPEIGQDALPDLFAGRGIRLSAYGDPAAVPCRIWYAATSRAEYWTGYTHQWRTCDRIFAKWCMASCETHDDRMLAKALGYRTFRIAEFDARADRGPHEIVCPASAEMGHKTTCDHCRACGGYSSKAQTDVVITIHGTGIKKAKVTKPDRFIGN